VAAASSGWCHQGAIFPALVRLPKGESVAPQLDVQQKNISIGSAQEATQMAVNGWRRSKAARSALLSLCVALRQVLDNALQNASPKELATVRSQFGPRALAYCSDSYSFPLCCFQ